MGPWSLRSGVTSRHASGTHMICVANQGDYGERHLQTRQHAANQSEPRRSSTYKVLMFWWFSGRKDRN